MLSIADYKKKYIDKQGKAIAVLINNQGESFSLGDVTTVTYTKGRLKCKWLAKDVPLQWHPYTHIALIGDGEPQYLQEITPLHFDGKSAKVEVTFYE